MADLKTCPFCGAMLEYEERVAFLAPGQPTWRMWAHPAGDCILSGLEVPKEDHKAWNRRTDGPYYPRDHRDEVAKDCPLQPLVKCENCKYCRKEDEYEYWCYGFCSTARLVRKDDFCSYGCKK